MEGQSFSKVRVNQPGRTGFPAFLFLVLLSLINGCSTAPEKASSFKTVFDHYRDREGILAISFPPGLVSIFLSEDDPEQAELKELIRELSSFRMLSVENSQNSAGTAASLRQLVNSFTQRNGFEDLLRVQAAEQDTYVRILDKNGSIREAILMFDAESGFFVVDLRGNISLEHFTRFIEAGHAGSLASLADIDF